MTPAAPNAGRSGLQLLRGAFVLVPVVSGFDKLAGVLVDWERHVSPAVAAWLPIRVELALYAVGLLEILLGLLVLASPRLGGLVLSVWFGASVVNSALLGENWHIAMRDAGLAIGALALASLSRAPELAGDPLSAREPRLRRRGRARSPRSDTLVSAPDE